MRNSKIARNEAFFQSRKTGPTALSFSTIFRAARETGSLNMSSKRLKQIPPEVFCLDANVEEGEKFWEVYPLTKIDLSHNEISHLNPEFSALLDLTSLKLRVNRVSLLPAFILGPKLRHLDLSSNEINHCEPADSGYLDLQECFLQDNSIDVFPQFILAARDLRVLDLNNNRIQLLPDDMCSLRNLSRISMNGNMLDALPFSFGMAFSALLTLDLRKNQLTILPPFTGLSALQVLDVGENALNDFPMFSSPCALSIVHLDCNQIHVLEAERLSAVQASLNELHIHDNKLCTLCPEIGLLNNLKVLNICNNDIGDLPASLGYVETLQRLSLDGNPIRAIRRSLLSQSTTDLKTYLRTRGPPLNGQIQATLLPSGFAADKDGVYGVSVAGVDGTGVVQMESHIVNRLRQISGGNLDLSGLQLVNMPSGWLTFVERTESIDSTDLSISLTTLNLSDNAFVDIPIDLVRDARLSPRSLDISANCLGRGLTERSDGCPLYPPSLSSLDAAKNGLTVGHMKALLSGNKRDGSCSLSRLMLSHNVITGMPSGSKGYRGLRELQISFNKLTTLENVDFSQFQHLEILDISNNKILSLGCIYDVSSLRTLLLDNNELDAIPYQLCFLKNLQSLSIHGNPQRTVRQGVIQKGTEAIIAALQSKVPMEYHHPAVASATVAVRATHTTPLAYEESPSRQHHQQQQQYLGQEQERYDMHRTLSGAAVEGQRRRHHGRGQGYGQTHDQGGCGPSSLLDYNSQGQASQCEDSVSMHPTVTGGSTSSSVEVDKSELTTKINDLNAQIADIEDRLQSSSVSEASRYALKKEMAKARANVLRLRRTAG